jgi:hypothetical protein
MRLSESYREVEETVWSAAVAKLCRYIRSQTVARASMLDADAFARWANQVRAATCWRLQEYHVLRKHRHDKRQAAATASKEIGGPACAFTEDAALLLA